ncbi:HalOD1 output domain-containing protein [Halobacterium jilantaiense]|uniref:Halobacterial output domain-containing protein n=1 Tax=Halobacterium jilantaiense TaxID=355548 RepID=A0A1I0PV74_9EURY|nr:HalOD1 output domain-containing protein [Halobacterium jilantaiense]SEW18378.1 hypothetical protein SAMN04487945_1995 [Halobacterium jilantaiense]
MSEASTEHHVPSLRVIHALADATDTEPHEVDPPLYESVDGDALDALVASATDLEISFDHGDHTVVVRGDGTVSVDGASDARVPEVTDT